MNIELIITFTLQDQSVLNYLIEESLFQSKEHFVRTLKMNLSEDFYMSEVLDICKISCCVYNCNGWTPPSWYVECNGKFYFTNGVLDA